MEKNKNILTERQRFVNQVINDKKQGVETLKDVIKQLESSQNTTQRVQILSELLFLSEQTIFKDYANAKIEKHYKDENK